MKININGPGHITKMAAMAINSKNHYKSSSSYDFETWPEAPMKKALQIFYKS